MRTEINSLMKVVMTLAPQRGTDNTMVFVIGRGTILIRKRKGMVLLFRTGLRALYQESPIASPHSPLLSPL